MFKALLVSLAFLGCLSSAQAFTNSSCATQWAQCGTDPACMDKVLHLNTKAYVATLRKAIRYNKPLAFCAGVVDPGGYSTKEGYNVRTSIVNN